MYLVHGQKNGSIVHKVRNFYEKGLSILYHTSKHIEIGENCRMKNIEVEVGLNWNIFLIV